jgi:hypothetical protein
MSVRGFRIGVPLTRTPASQTDKRLWNEPILTYTWGECNAFYFIFLIKETNAVSFMTWIATMNNHQESLM